MKKIFLLLGISFGLSCLLTPNIKAQTIPTVSQVNNFFNNKNLLVTYREGEVVYGTYYFLEIHYCPSGQYGLYGRSVKQTVMGNEQQNSWQEFGTWKVMKYMGNVGVYYRTTTDQENFVPVYRLSNGALSVGEGISIVNQGVAICR